MRALSAGARFGVAVAALAATQAFAQEAVIRKNVAERMPELPKIDEVTKTSIPGLYELRIGTDIFYSDEQGNHLIQGSIIDTRTRTDLTQARIDKLTAVDFATLPLKDAIVWRQGTGARKVAVFADPNCGYCKRFEKDLQGVKDVTVYTFLYPMLGGDSPQKSRDIWCAEEPTKAWREWMIEGKAPSQAMGQCDASVLESHGPRPQAPHHRDAHLGLRERCPHPRRVAGPTRSKRGWPRRRTSPDAWRAASR
jgi:thiol:disulfide interchange protein DsbC